MWGIIFWVFCKKRIYGFLGKEVSRNSFLFDRAGSSCKMIKEGAGSWRALDATYNHHPRVYGSFWDKIDDFWIGMMNAQAVRNRLRLVKVMLPSVLKSFAKPEVLLVSLGSGSAEGIFETALRLQAEDGITVKMILVDTDPTALDHSLRKAFEYGLADQVQIRRGNVFQVKKLLKDVSPDVIEMLGLLDYISCDYAIRLTSSIYDLLKPGGHFLTCNIKSNPERFFLKWVINWDMIYRSPQEFARILVEAGFRGSRLIYEPLGIHGIAISKK
jgi:SAM-dependent methyltransferase